MNTQQKQINRFLQFIKPIGLTAFTLLMFCSIAEAQNPQINTPVTIVNNTKQILYFPTFSLYFNNSGMSITIDNIQPRQQSVTNPCQFKGRSYSCGLEKFSWGSSPHMAFDNFHCNIPSGIIPPGINGKIFIRVEGPNNCSVFFLPS